MYSREEWVRQHQHLVNLAINIAYQAFTMLISSITLTVLFHAAFPLAHSSVLVGVIVFLLFQIKSCGIQGAFCEIVELFKDQSGDKSASQICTEEITKKCTKNFFTELRKLVEEFLAKLRSAVVSFIAPDDDTKGSLMDLYEKEGLDAADESEKIKWNAEKKKDKILLFDPKQDWNKEEDFKQIERNKLWDIRKWDGIFPKKYEKIEKFIPKLPTISEDREVLP